MKTFVLLAALVAVALSANVPTKFDFFKSVDKEFVTRQKLVLDLLKYNSQDNTAFEYYKIGKDYDVRANIDNYTNKKAVEEFLFIYENRFTPQEFHFTVFNDRMREEAIALYHLFYYAKDFDTFIKTAAWARVYVNEPMFVYSFSIAVIYRADTRGLILPIPAEIYPTNFLNVDVINKLRRIKMQGGLIDPVKAEGYGITLKGEEYTVLANYTGWFNFDNEEQKISYFTEDMGLNTYYYYFHLSMPFWMTQTTIEDPIKKEYPGELFYFFHQQLLARYYMERLTNGLGEIPELSWSKPVKTGYTPNLVSNNLYPFVTRNNWYQLQTPENFHDLQYLESFEQHFLQILEEGYYKGVALKDWKTNSFFADIWGMYGMTEKAYASKNYVKYYEIIARVLLGAAPETTNEYYTAPVALEQFTTALRDPVFFQLYKRMLSYFLKFKEYYMKPYTRESLSFSGVKINDVKVDDLETYFDTYTYEATYAVYRSQAELKESKYWYKVVQPRLNHKAFNVDIEIKSEVSTDALIKIFLGPKYDSYGNVIQLEDNWMNFIELDFFKTKLNPGKNMIVRSSEDFILYKNDSISTYELKQLLEQGKVPVDMSEYYNLMPRRLMLPKGTKGGFPFQMFVMVSPYVPVSHGFTLKGLVYPALPTGYPFDRPMNDMFFFTPNMYMKDVSIRHVGEYLANDLMIPYEHYHNTVSKQ